MRLALLSLAVLATVAIHAVGESSVPWAPQAFSTTEDTQR